MKGKPIKHFSVPVVAVYLAVGTSEDDSDGSAAGKADDYRAACNFSTVESFKRKIFYGYAVPVIGIHSVVCSYENILLPVAVNVGNC